MLAEIHSLVTFTYSCKCAKFQSVFRNSSVYLTYKEELLTNLLPIWSIVENTAEKGDELFISVTDRAVLHYGCSPLHSFPIQQCDKYSELFAESVG